LCRVDIIGQDVRRLDGGRQVQLGVGVQGAEVVDPGCEPLVHDGREQPQPQSGRLPPLFETARRRFDQLKGLA